MDIRNKKILIVGFGRSGQATAAYCLKEGAIVSVTDSNVAAELALPKFGKASFATTAFGSHPTHIFTESDMIVVSPGVPLDIEPLKAARKKGVPIIGEMELVLGKLDAPVVAITGTNGKSTVTTLIGEILKEAGKNVLVGGNLGTPLIELIRDCHSRAGGNLLHALDPRLRGDDMRIDFVVLEISSYQLEITPSLHPHVAVLLNITPDHLDRYASYEDYINAKALITKNLEGDDFLIYNEDDELVADIAKKASARLAPFSLKGKKAFKEIDLSKAKITGAHNQENMLAAMWAAYSLGVKVSVIQKVFEKFPGLPHRNQFVAEVAQVKYYDDSKGTNVGAVVKSLEGFNSKVILIAGGLDKGGSYSPLRPLVKEKVKGLVLIGAAKEKIARELGDLTRVVTCDSMAAAVREAAAMAASGDVVLLSPACASFDMFKDYADRGNKFAEEVKKLGR